MAGVAADNIHPAFAPDKLTVCAAFFYRSLYFHLFPKTYFLQPSRDTSFASVGVKLEEHLVSYQNFYPV